MAKGTKLDSLDRAEDITPEEVRQFEKFKDLTDEQVKNMVDTIIRLSSIAFNIYKKRKKSGKVVAFDIENQTQQAA
jgi:hypothetical protein